MKELRPPDVKYSLLSLCKVDGHGSLALDGANDGLGVHCGSWTNIAMMPTFISLIKQTYIAKQYFE